MKIDIRYIIGDHLRTLKDANTSKLSKIDVLTFYLVPATLGAVAYWGNVTLPKDFAGLSVTFFGIFIALLLNIQVAIFGIFQRKWEAPEDTRSAEIQRNTLIVRGQLARELNANISYLVLICCFCLTIFVILFCWARIPTFFMALSIFVFSHFLLTLLMIVKRAHALFQKEYTDGY